MTILIKEIAGKLINKNIEFNLYNNSIYSRLISKGNPGSYYWNFRITGEGYAFSDWNKNDCVSKGKYGNLSFNENVISDRIIDLIIEEENS